MKKGIYAILAMLAVFAMVMVSCGGGGGGGGGGGPTVKITFDLNYTDAPAAKVVTVGKKAALSNKYPGAPAAADVPTGKVFLEWNSENDQKGNLISGNSKFSKDTTVYAIWANYSATADAIITFNYNYGSPAFQIFRVVEGAKTTPNSVDPFPGTPGQTGKFFRGWFSKATGAGVGSDRATADSVFDDDAIFYAAWATNGTKDAPATDELRIDYNDGSFQYVVVVGGETTWAQVLEKLSRKTDLKDEANRFKGWKKSATETWADADVVNAGGITIEAAWLSGAITGISDEWEKIYTENGTIPVYEFNLGTGNTLSQATLAKIKWIKATYAVSEAALDLLGSSSDKGNITYRYFGPYIYSATAAQPKEGGEGGEGKVSPQTWYGDFMLTNNDQLVARWDGTGVKPGIFAGGTLNKFQPYFMVNGGNFVDGATGNNNGGTGTANYDAIATKDTWAATTIYLNTNLVGVTGTVGTYNYPNTLKLLEQVLTNGKGENGTQVVPQAALSSTKVYFGIGIARRNGGNGDGSASGDRSPWQHGIISLVKDVKLWIDLNDDDNEDEGEVIVGVKPSFTIGSTTITQVFSGYAPGDLGYGWRGPKASPVVMVQGPAYIPPAPVAPAVSSYTVKAPALKSYQSDKADDGTVMYVIENNKITFKIGEDNYNGNNETNKKYGGGGFKIIFDEIDLPEDYRAYKNIVLDLTIAGKTADSLQYRQIIFSAPEGGDVTSVNGSSNQWITIGTDNESKAFSFATNRLNMAAGKDVGIAVRANNYSTNEDDTKSNVPIEGTITVNRITFTLN